VEIWLSPFGFLVWVYNGWAHATLGVWF